jgi:hypothetical protein
MKASGPARRPAALLEYQAPRPGRTPRLNGVAEISTFSANDAEQAIARLRSIYGADVVVTHLAGGRPLTVQTVTSALGDVRLIRSKLSGWSLTRSLDDQVLVVFPIEGSMTFSAGGRNFVVEANRQAAVGWPFEKIRL